MLKTSIKRLEFLTDVVPHLFIQLDAEAAREKPAPDKWSPTEILGHLCDSALHNWQRFATISFCATPYRVKTYQQDKLVSANHYQEAHIGSILQLWVGLNRQILFIWNHYSPEDQNKTILLPDDSAANLAFLIKDYLDHLEHHLQQIFHSSLNIEVPFRQFGEGILPGNDILQILFRKGAVSVELYQPKLKDYQNPHVQEEFYFIAGGTADFNKNGLIQEVKSGDFLFVPAGMPHHFLNFSDDFSTWVVFF